MQMNTKSVFEVVSMPHRLLSPPPPPTPIHHIVESPFGFCVSYLRIV